MEELQTTLVFIGLIAFFIMVTLMLGVRERRRTRSKLLHSLRESFGRPVKKKTSPERYAQIPQYYRHHPDGFRIDDITWNDLDLDLVFRAMDSTCSAAGEEYLYHLLRAPALKSSDLPYTQDQYGYFAGGAHEEERVRLQEILTGLGHAGRYSLYDYIDFTTGLGERSNLPHYIAAAAPFAAFALMFLHTGIGILAMLIVFSINLITYFREKAKVAAHYQVFNYILRLLDCAQELEKAGCPVFAEDTKKIPELMKAFSSFRRGSSLLLGSVGGGADPLGLLLEYIRILFHLDLIKFNSMLRQMRGKQPQIDELLTITGRIDACISIVSWRETLPYFAVPDLREESAFPFSVRGLFHPLLADPVSNSLTAEKPVLLTGSNASGKSTFLKAAALCALLSQSVGIAPARSYSGACFRIFTSMALRDSLQDGESYFIVEIKSLRRILLASQETESAPVLCCIDEVLRGTNTVERISASAEILRCFAGTDTACFAATHDVELTGLLADVYDNYHFSEEITDGDVRFSYRLQPGPSNTCNAIALLGALGYDRALVSRASARADRFLAEGKWQ
ncbi:MAG: hypothetical protein Q4C16_06260 [Eubacteriales bacterium]|nr:hypothetical protein [Eubacteriales bacterium]